MKPAPTKPKVNWTDLPDRITQDEVKIEITFKSDRRTTEALERQAKKIGFDSVSEYIHSNVVQSLCNDEEDTILTDDGRLLFSSDGYDDKTAQACDV
jgi:hypothetical protein